MKASDLFVKALEAEGVSYIFGIPGEENLDMLNSLRASNIKLILSRHEQAAGFMAATYGRLTGNAGVCLSTLGPGASNFVTAAAYGQLGALPMVMITGQKPIKHSKQGQFQIIDVVDMMKPLTKYTKQITSGDTIPATVREAFRLAQEERPGATHLELPEDIACETTQTSVISACQTRRPT
ncbi:MAG: thiamine pyrophosphate-binding protein, partial [Chloroflexota bacterium]